MLVPLAVLQLLLVQASPAGNPPLPGKGASAAAPQADARQLSLLSGESLGGGSASLAWAGWSSLGLMYGQGIDPQDDLAGFADLDWSSTELRLGGLYRRSLGQAGSFDVAGRLSAAWFRSFGATWVHSDNHSDYGLEVAPGVALSTHTGGGVFSTIVDAPLTFTFQHGSGLLFSPRLSFAYEAQIYPDFTLGALLGAGYRAGSGDAPLKDGHAELRFLVVAGYQLL